MTEDIAIPTCVNVESPSQSEDRAAAASSRILESTDEQLESASAEGEKEAGKEQAEPEAPLRVPSLVHRNGYLLETVYKPDDGKWPLRFNYYHLGKRREHGSPIPFDLRKIQPPLLDDMVRQGVVLLPSRGSPVSAVQQASLVGSLIRFVHRYLDIPPFWEKMVAHYVLMTWVYDRFTAVPYLRLLSEHGTGKSRFLQVVGALCYKSIICGGSVSVSSVFRLTDQWRGTLALDECDFNHSGEWAEIIRLLNCGYMAKLPAVRSESVGRSFAPRAFHVFGPKILAGRHRFEDSALESRCLTYTPVERTLRSDIPRQLPEKFWDEALELRNQLLGWRFENFDNIRVDETPLLHLDPRLAQIGTTLHSVTNDEVFRGEYLKFLSEFGEEDRSERPQSVIVEAIHDLSSELAADPERYAQLNIEALGHLSVKAVTDHANRLIQNRGGNQMSPKRAGGIIRSLGFKPKRTRDGYRFLADPQRIEDLVTKYVPNIEQ
jgi:hypothetical protein